MSNTHVSYWHATASAAEHGIDNVSKAWHFICFFPFRMILNAEALEIIAYLKTARGKFVSLREISLKAGGRRRFEESPDWAKSLIQPLMEAGHIQVNARGHYRVPVSEPPQPQAQTKTSLRAHYDPAAATVVGDDYFPSKELKPLVGGDYFPTPETD